MKNLVFLNVLPDMIPPTSGEWENIEQWGISLATTYDPGNDAYIHWNDESAEQCLVSHLCAQDLVISYNWSFDRQILSAYGKVNRVPAFSLMDQIQRQLGLRLRLQNFGNANGIDSTKVDLADFLSNNPDKDQRIGYNTNKIRTMNGLIQKAIIDGSLLYYGTGEDRTLRIFHTTAWDAILNGHAHKF